MLKLTETECAARTLASCARGLPAALVKAAQTCPAAAGAPRTRVRNEESMEREAEHRSTG